VEREAIREKFRARRIGLSNETSYGNIAHARDDDTAERLKLCRTSAKVELKIPSPGSSSRRDRLSHLALPRSRRVPRRLSLCIILSAIAPLSAAVVIVAGIVKHTRGAQFYAEQRVNQGSSKNRSSLLLLPINASFFICILSHPRYCIMHITRPAGRRRNRARPRAWTKRNSRDST